jgi:hypothetical protein
MSSYDDMKVGELRQECKKLGIKECQQSGYIKKDELIKLLKAFSKKTESPKKEKKSKKTESPKKKVKKSNKPKSPKKANETASPLKMLTSPKAISYQNRMKKRSKNLPIVLGTKKVGFYESSHNRNIITYPEEDGKTYAVIVEDLDNNGNLKNQSRIILPLSKWKKLIEIMSKGSLVNYF